MQIGEKVNFGSNYTWALMLQRKFTLDWISIYFKYLILLFLYLFIFNVNSIFYFTSLFLLSCLTDKPIMIQNHSKSNKDITCLLMHNSQHPII